MLDTDPYLDPHWNQCGSTTLAKKYRFMIYASPGYEFGHAIVSSCWAQCCVSASPWCGCGSGSCLSLWCGSGSWFLVDADPDTACHPDADADPDLDPGSQNDADPCGSGFYNTGWAPFFPAANLFLRITFSFYSFYFLQFFAGWERIRRALTCVQWSPASSPSRWSWRSTSAQVHQYRTVLEFLNNLWGARNRAGIGLSYRPARLHSLAELVPLNRFLGSLKV